MAIYRGAGGSGDATTDATNQASVASDAAVAAANSATSAATSATNASNSATAAASSASSASSSASTATTQASNASTSASNASTSASNAATSETNAATSASNAATSYDNFDDRYLGSKSSAPSVDNDGNTLLTGALYWNSTSSTMNVWTGSAWTGLGGGSGTVTSVAALTLGTTGTDLSSTVANSTTTPVITLNVPTASATNRGVLSSTDWTTFNNKGSGTVTGVTGTAPIVSSGGATPAISITAATTSAAGSMSSADKTKLDGIATGANNYTLPTATSTANGGVELFSDTVQSVAANAVTTTASRTYGVQLNGSGQAVINVPWTDTNSGGTVTSASVVSANGFAGTVATATTTPAITLTTSITGVLKGNGTAISAAVSGTDYAPATSGTSILYGNGSGGFSNVTVGSGLSFTAGTLSASGGGGMTYPTGSGIAVVVSGTSWGTTLTAPSGTIVGTSDTQTLTNKRITSRTSTTTSSATPTINTDTTDQFGLTAQAVDITSFTTNLSGTPTDGQKLWIYIVGTAARAITWGASFEASTVSLPTTTVSTNRLDVGFVWNTTTSKWRCVAVA